MTRATPRPHDIALGPGVDPHAAPKRSLTKIIATIGPASEHPDVVAKLIQAGVSVFRLNFSHGTLEDHARRLATVRAVAQALGTHVAAMGDLQGPKIRVGQCPPQGVELRAGQDVVIRPAAKEATTERWGGDDVVVLPTSYEAIVREVEPGHRVLINDGAVRMLAVGRSIDRGELLCRVLVGGKITTGKGINLPQSDVSAPAITTKDWECVRFAVEHGMDYLALSFVRTAAEVRQLRDALAGMCPVDRVHADQANGAMGASRIAVVSKIEKPQAVERIEEIVQASDAIMVARGDLGVEMDIARVPVTQKAIVAACQEWGRPCIVATQMLETMIENATPTRAEASDVGNAIFDGADAIMLSAETASGKHPVLVVETMRRIAEAAEAHIADAPWRQGPPRTLAMARDVVAALAHGARHVAKDLHASLIVCWSETGGVARALSQYDFQVPIFAFTSDVRVARRMALLRGVTPMTAQPPASGLVADWLDKCNRDLPTRGLARVGETALVIAGRPVGVSGSANVLAVHRFSA